MAWTIAYTETAKNQLGKLDRAIARRIVDYMDRRIALLEDACSTVQMLTGALRGLWRCRVGDAVYRLNNGLSAVYAFFDTSVENASYGTSTC